MILKISFPDFNIQEDKENNAMVSIFTVFSCRRPGHHIVQDHHGDYTGQDHLQEQHRKLIDRKQQQRHPAQRQKQFERGQQQPPRDGQAQQIGEDEELWRGILSRQHTIQLDNLDRQLRYRSRSLTSQILHCHQQFS